MSWTVETLNETVDAEIESLPEDMRARLAHIAKLIEEKGLERVGEPHLKHIEGRLWEMRLKGHSGISRALLGQRAVRGVFLGDGDEAAQAIGLPHRAGHQLTPQETEILKLLVEGHSYKTAAAELGISTNTVSFHLKNIYTKLQVHSKSEAVSKALRNKIV